MTEYDVEQLQKERLAQVNSGLVCEQLADDDRRRGFEVESKSAMWPAWHKLREEREAAGWELASYGQCASLFTRSGFFKRRMKSNVLSPSDGLEAKVGLTPKLYASEEQYQPCYAAPVHILATVRPANPAGLDAATLVFKTLRTGFPTAPVYVWGNALPAGARNLFRSGSADGSGINSAFRNIPATSHDAWIETLLLRSTSPFWICDTDIVFHSSIESFVLPDECAMAGRWEPEFNEEFTRTIHVERLHTCLMWFDPARVRAAMHAWIARIPAPFGPTAQFPFVRQHFIPTRRDELHESPIRVRDSISPVRDSCNSSLRTLFYDTTAGLWHANIGTPFTEAQDAAFDHLHCATYVDLMDAPSLSGLRAMHEQVYANPSRIAGLRLQQNIYYAQRGANLRPAPSEVRQFIATHSDDELIKLSHASRDELLPLLQSVQGGNGLEIGAWKGESTVWFLQHGLARMDVIEPFSGSQEHRNIGSLRVSFDRNTEGFSDRIRLHAGYSDDVLVKLQAGDDRFDFVYVDGSHESRDVVLDAVLAWKLLKPGGLMVFDDYLFEFYDNRARNPAAAIDFFLASHAHELTVLKTGCQVVVRKHPSAPPVKPQRHRGTETSNSAPNGKLQPI